VTVRTPELKQLLSAAEFKKTRAYSIDKVQFGFFSAGIGHFISILFLSWNGIPWLWDYASRLTQMSVGRQDSVDLKAYEVSHY
jgi:hypothetical protein